ncbi:6-phosphogluconolactonase [Corynebacterium efficiens YS-314]|uniref:6-phosphogluconolactonase n=1 Tax=Corynebacterium efficiens (strain DSM 44549 / YS-314 / AJ 12310 / JCM 11189 / NBRC 100395) TaxID=196164 RepID=Q8FT72_COREF|nr:6-phosphogluconolactonase [Corynebacterium efficiens]EEW49671.1 6-phosphogluconolactonase [Corynebacterium efficiens YS-314]BAC18508.1 putative 6-phosphogluconolactonase [Corynebacterium efficiens YS-314]
MVEVIRVTDTEDLVNRAAERFVDVARAATAPGGGINYDGVARIVLTGGTAGIKLLEKVAGIGADLPWEKIHIFFGDERNVPVTHPESNEGQAREALLSRVAIPEDNIHGYGLEGLDAAALAESAADYERVIDQFAPRGFDLHLLGMGYEGHINSLFPHTDAVREETRRVIPVLDSPKPPAERATLTLPAVRSSQRVWLLVSGAEKAEAAAAVVGGASAEDWPAAGATGAAETLMFLADDAATGI